MAEMVKVSLTYTGQLAQEAGSKTETVAVEVGTPLLQLLAEYAQRQSERFRELLFSDAQELRKSIIVAVDGTQIADPQKYAFDDDAEVLVMTPIAGG
jgi:molybdopterin converting factor small subunit